MIPKQLFLDKEGQEKLREGVKMFSAAVKSTLGPSGRTVLLESENIVGGVGVTKDGVTVARNLRFEDPIHDMAAIMLRQAAEKTAGIAGDGTTTSVVLTEAILNAYDKYADPNKNVDTLRMIQCVCDSMIEQMEEASIPVTGEMLKHVATISANNDSELGHMIAEVFENTDIVTVKDSMTSDTYTEVINGLTIDKGFVSRLFITDQKKQECVLNNPYVLLYDQEIQNLHGLAKVLEEIIRSDRSLLIVGNLGREALHALNLNVVKGVIKCAVVTPPDFGYRKSEKMSDLATVLGGKFYSEDTGDDLQLVDMQGLGTAKSVTISENTTVIEPLDDDQTKLRMISLVSDLKELVSSKETELEKEPYESRLECISGSYGVIYVGAQTAIEQKEIKDRVDDAVCAVRAAKREGVLPGGGKALIDSLLYGFGIASKIMEHVVEAPLRQMLINSGIDDKVLLDDIVSKVRNGKIGYDIKNGQMGDMVARGIIDPAMVTKSSLINAVSVATTILSTSCIITNVREIQK